MLKENQFRFIRVNRFSPCPGFWKCCAAIVFCFLPLIYEPIFSFAGQEGSKIFNGKINNMDEISCGAQIPIIECPLFFSSLELRQCFINFVSELTGGNRLSIIRSAIFGETMLNQSSDEITKNTAESGSRKEGDWVHSFLLGLYTGVLISLFIPIPKKYR